MRKVKVAFFAEILIVDFDGASRTMFQLIDRIPQDRFEFLFICGDGSKQVGGFECLKTPSLHIPINKSYSIALPMLSKKRLHDRLGEFAPDVIHIATPSLLGHFALHYAQKQHIPVISIYHTHFISYIDYYLRNIPFLIGSAKRKMLAKQNDFYNSCNKVYVPSDSLAHELMAGGMEPSTIKIWKRGIDRRLFTPFKRDKRRMKLLTGNDRPCILFASRLVWEKNLQTLIDLYNLVQKENLPYNIVVVGDGTDKNRCQKHMPLAVFTGHLDHDALSYIYASSSVFFFPSTTETFGNVVLEAMASGLPCVIADGGGSKDFIIEGVNGYKCPAHDARAFLEKIELVVQRPRIAMQLAMEALEFSKAYDWDLLSAIYFEELINMAKMEMKGKDISPEVYRHVARA